MEITKLKLLYVLDIIKGTDYKNPLTAPQIVEKLLKVYGIEAERKSVCRDIASLCEYGYDIKSDEKVLGFYMASREFEDWELKVLIDAVWQAKFLSLQDSKNIENKLKRFASADSQKLLTRVIPVKSKLKVTNYTVKNNIDLLLTAIREEKKVSFKYTTIDENLKIQYRKKGKEYIVNPYYLVWLHDNYYLICNYDEYKNLSYYRLDRIEHICKLKDQVKPINEIIGDNPDLKIEDAVLMDFYQYNGEKIQLSLKVDKGMVPELVDYFGTNLRIREVNGFLYVSVQVNESEGLYYWLLQHGEYIEIVAPLIVRNNYITKLKSILMQYKD